MKKIIALVLVLALAVSLLAACGQENTIGEANAAASQDDGKLRIVTTIFPEYDWVREILGDQADRADLTMLLDNGVDLHSYQPTADDIAKIADCDLFLYVGGESDEWVDDALKESANPNQKVIDLMDVLSDEIKEEEHVEGMQAEEEEPLSAEAEEEGAEYDEHVWLSLRNAETLCTAITNALGELDPDHKDIYTANASTYLQKLDQLDQSYRQTVDAAARNTLLFGDRFPFLYFCREFGLKYYAAFPGCANQTEPNPETVAFLIDKVKQDGIPVVFHIELSNGQMARAIADATGAQVRLLNAVHNVSAEDFEKGITYLDLMRHNLNVLKEALN